MLSLQIFSNLLKQMTTLLTKKELDFEAIDLLLSVSIIQGSV